MMMPCSTAALAVALSLCLSPWVEGQGCGTKISGPTVSGTWTAARSPYCLTGSVNVTSLTIQPGVTVRFSNLRRMTVTGTIQAVGTAAQPIVFTANNPSQRWGGILFTDAPAGSRFSHCRFEKTNGSMLRLTNTSPAIDNCTFSDSATRGLGGGIQVTLATGDFAVTDCIFSNHLSLNHGAGLFATLASGTLRVTGCTFINNSADAGWGPPARNSPAGGAIFVSGDSEIRQCRFVGNQARGVRSEHTALGRGGAIYYALGNATLENCLFTGNRADGSYQSTTIPGRARAYGGAIYVAFASLAATNCLLSANATSTDGSADMDDKGAGIFVEGGPADLVNCTVTRGTTLSGVDGGAYFLGGSSTIRNSILYFNQGSQVGGPGAPTVTYSNVEGAQVFAGTGNINLDPGFAGSSAGCDIVAAGSPCIDAGDPSSADNDVCFPPSLGGARNDMGAHGGPLACGWNGNVNLALSTSPAVLPTPGQLTLAVAGGNPGRPAVFFVTAVNGAPTFVWLPFVGTICPDGSSSLPLAIPAAVPGTTLDFQGFSIDGAGVIVGSNSAGVTLQ